MTRGDWRVYVITDSHQARGRSHREIAEAVIRGGATAVQLRMKEEPARVMLAAAREIAPLCRAAGAVFIVNDRVDVARIGGADGLPLGQHDLPARDVRALMGAGALIGVAAAAVAAGVAAGRVRARERRVGAG